MKRYIRANLREEETISWEENPQVLGDVIEDCWYEAMTKLGLEPDEIHLLDYKHAKEFEQELVKQLRSQGVDLSYKSVTLWPGMTVSGNTTAIANDLVRRDIKDNWYKAEVDAQDIEEADHYTIYEKDRYGYPQKCSKSRALSLLGIKTGFSDHGYGSQAYSDETKRTCFRDEFGNIMIDVSVLRWD